MTASRKLKDLRTAGLGYVAFGLIAPNVFATHRDLGRPRLQHGDAARPFELGTYVLFSVLCARGLVHRRPGGAAAGDPRGEPDAPLAASLGLTFSYNVTHRHPGLYRDRQGRDAYFPGLNRTPTVGTAGLSHDVRGEPISRTVHANKHLDRFRVPFRSGAAPPRGEHQRSLVGRGSGWRVRRRPGASQPRPRAIRIRAVTPSGSSQTVRAVVGLAAGGADDDRPGSRSRGFPSIHLSTDERPSPPRASSGRAAASSTALLSRAHLPSRRAGARHAPSRLRNGLRPRPDCPPGVNDESEFPPRITPVRVNHPRGFFLPGSGRCCWPSCQEPPALSAQERWYFDA